MKQWRRGGAAGLLALAMGAASAADVDKLLGMDLQALMALPLVTASKTEEAYFTTPAAVSVITSAQIRASRAENLGDLFVRLPGIGVYQLSRERVAVGVRGDGRLIYNSLLLLVDGQSLYHPVMEGPWWESVSVSLQDIDRIELVRGAGGSAWGANSAAGVINIITKNAASGGRRLEASGGNEDWRSGYAAWNGENGLGDFRISAEARAHDGFGEPQFEQKRFALRQDATVAEWKTSFNLRGLNASQPETSLIPNPVYENLLRNQTAMVNGQHRSGDRVLRLQAGFHHEEWNAAVLGLKNFAYRSTDLEAQYEDKPSFLPFVDRVMLAANWRDYLLRSPQWTGTAGAYPLTFLDGRSYQDLSTLAATVWFRPGIDSVKVQLGVRGEHYSISNDNVLWSPSLRVGWEADPSLFLWAAYNRSYQLPNYAQRAQHLQLTTTAPIGYQVGDPDLEEQLVEQTHLGLRTLWQERHSVDFNLFHHLLDNQIAANLNGPFTFVPGVGVEARMRNLLRTHVNGAELEWSAQWGKGWRTRANYTYLDQDSKVIQAGTTNPVLNKPFTYDQKFHFGATGNVAPRTSLDLGLTWYADYLSEGRVFQRTTAAAQRVDYQERWVNAHTRLDVTLNYELAKDFTGYLAVKNLLNDDVEWYYRSLRHPAVEVEPTYRIGLEWEL